ncbi:hypothetical protein CHLRE_45g760897v5 [Chlamydomonas reinhardtii]|uniref:Uncharacterized protein n=1 Tax=Chlamydomonas reinhardtii TaxID=3055 RepID=A0A2K3CMT1_CHLRE|nr:uncharacterized protein CHLRE_45g760897v5 [Chlamydomonas reinhardtii]PNW69589.1 hypothetical protein CHLRE_45g760897v5 [Chlamydomonas reinhardtii]
MPGLLDRRLAGLDLRELYADLYQPDIIHEAASSPDVKGRRVLAILVAAKAPPEELLAPPFLAAVGLRGCHARAFAAAGAVAAQAQEWAGAGAGAGAALCCEANIKAAVVATAAMARMDANPDVSGING